MKILSIIMHTVSMFALCFGLYLIGQMYIDYGEDVRPFIFILAWTIGDAFSELAYYFRGKAKK